MKFDDVRNKGFRKRIKLHQAINTCITSFNKFPEELISLKTTSLNQKILAEDVYAKRSIPPFDRSAMDGYAVRANDTFGASENNPLALTIIDKLQIGQVPMTKVKEGTLIKIPTGGMMPEGADAVLMIEDTAFIYEGGKEIEIYASVHPGKNVAKAGEDFNINELLFRAGRLLKPIDRAFLLSAGVLEVKTSIVPKIAIFSTGNELVDAWTSDIAPGKIPDVNSLNLLEFCNEDGFEAEILGIISDNEQILRQVINDSTKDFDVILITGGSSVGEKDFIPKILNELGNLAFHGIAMRPGGPICASQIGNSIIFGLPGFPAASLIGYQFIVRPVIFALMGLNPKIKPLTVQARISRNVGSKLGRLDFLRVRLKRSSVGEFLAEPIQIGGSGLLRSIVNGNAVIPIPESSEGLKEGDIVETFVLGKAIIQNTQNSLK
ncbi:MAG: molybdopterin molybdotransferase MoeA [Candidatus Hodarchaeales archaeon]